MEARSPLTWLQALPSHLSGDGPALYVVDKQTGALSLTRVVVMAYESTDVLISGGVDEGACAVALGVQKLDPAQRVKVVSALSF